MSRAQVGLISSAIVAGGVSTAFLGGWVVDVLGVRRVMTVLLIVLGLMMMVFPLVSSISLLLLLCVFIGATEAPGYPAGVRAIMDWLPRNIRGMGMNLRALGAPLGGSIAGIVLPIIAVAYGWRIAATALGVGILIIGIIFPLVYRDTDRSKTVAPRMNFATVRTLVNHRGVAIATLWGASFSAIHIVVLSYMLLFLIEILNVPPVLAGGYLAMAQGSSILGRLFWGIVSDLVFKGQRIVALCVLGFVASLALLATSLVGPGLGTIAVVPLVLILGATTMSWGGIMSVLIGELVGVARTGTALGGVATIMRLSAIVAPPLFGYVVDKADAYTIPWMAAAVLALISTSVLMLFGRDGQVVES